MLWSAMNQLCAQVQASSTHILFLPHDEYEQAKQIPQTINRLSYQFHWNNPHVHTFDEWLALFRAKTRKNIKTERKKARDGVDRLFHLWGHELTDRHIEKMWQFYCITIDRKWGKPYLTREFFDHLKGSLADQTLVFFAEKEGEIIASSLCFQRGDHLYGRYWGCSEFSDFLHFELCYHQPIEMCIQKGWTKFEAGAQGQHKLKRGLLPSPTYSVHRLQHPGLQRAVQEAMKRENNHVEREIHIQGQHGPFKRKPTAQK
jgi:predicted N-acyltransferase